MFKIIFAVRKLKDVDHYFIVFIFRIFYIDFTFRPDVLAYGEPNELSAANVYETLDACAKDSWYFNIFDCLERQSNKGTKKDEVLRMSKVMFNRMDEYYGRSLVKLRCPEL